MSNTTDNLLADLVGAIRAAQRCLDDIDDDWGWDTEVAALIRQTDHALDLTDLLRARLREGRDPGFEVFVNMQKRGDGKVYCDLHKTDERIYFTREDAQAAIDKEPDLAHYRHVVAITCRLSGEES